MKRGLKWLRLGGEQGLVVKPPPMKRGLKFAPAQRLTLVRSQVVKPSPTKRRPKFPRAEGAHFVMKSSPTKRRLKWSALRGAESMNQVVITSTTRRGLETLRPEVFTMDALDSALSLPLAAFHFVLSPAEPLFLPARNKGNVLRGAFGTAFRHIACLPECREA